MKIDDFWSDWNKNYRGIYWVLLFIFSIILIVALITQFYGIDVRFPHQLVRKTEAIQLGLHKLYDAVFEVDNEAKSYVVFQTFLSLESNLPNLIVYVFLAVSVLSVAFIGAAATYFSRLWFLIAQTVIVLWVITLKLPFLELFGFTSNAIQYIMVFFYISLGYIYHSFYPNVSLLKKFLSFVFLIALTLLAVYLGSPKIEPLLFIVHHSLIVPLILSVLFILNVAYDILLLILKLLSSQKTSDNSSNLLHFILFSVLYLSYITLTFLRNDFAIDWDIVYLNEFLLLLVSSVIGIWGFKKRSELLGNQLPFRPLGGYLYLVLGIITFTTISFVFITANDPVIEAFEDTIIFSHLGFGIAFFIYVVINFLEFLKNGIGIYPVLFNPKRLPYQVLRIVGLSIFGLMIFRVGYIPFFQAQSGHYLNVASYYDAVGNESASLTSTKVARQYAATSHLPNFNLAVDYYNKKEWSKSAYYFGKANYKRPSVQAYLNRAQALINSNAIFEALFTIKDAETIFEKNAYINNMKGLIFEQLNNVDSAFLYFETAYRANSNPQITEVALTNKLALLAKNNIKEIPSSSILQDFQSVPLKANYLALANVSKANKTDSITYDLPIDSSLTYNDFSFLFNALANQSLSGSLTSYDIPAIASLRDNQPFKKSLDYAYSLNLNYAGKQKSAFSYVYDLQNAEISDAGFYHMLHGKWLMDQEAYDLAVDQFVSAEKLKIKEASRMKVLALIRAKRLYEAARAFEDRPTEKLTAGEVIRDDLFYFLKGEVDSLSTAYKYLWLITNESISSQEEDQLIYEISETKYSYLYQLAEVEELIQTNDYRKAINLLTKINVISKDEDVLSKFNELKLALVFHQTDSSFIESVNKEQLATYPKNHLLLYEIYHTSDKQELDSLMLRLGMENVFFTEGLLIAANYFNEQEDFELAYKILVEATRLNPQDLKILKAYAIQSLLVSMRLYAADALAELKLKLSAEDLDQFLEHYNSVKNRIEEKEW